MKGLTAPPAQKATGAEASGPVPKDAPSDRSRPVEALAAKGFTYGTHRVVPPSATVARIKVLAPDMGITRVANVTGLDHIGIPVVMVCRPNSRSISVSQGKGLTLDAAQASGLMESIELYHSEHIGLPLLLGSWSELRGERRLVDVGRIATREGGRFHRNLRMLWIEGRDLISGEEVWVPFDTVHCDFTPTGRRWSSCFAITSNGLASGNHLLEAVSYALSEVVERDATTLWTLRGQPAQDTTQVDLDSVDDPACRQVLELYERAAVAVAVSETTSDIEIPSFRCVVSDASRDGPRALYAAAGYGCHPSRSIALLRALTEAAQSRAALIAGSRDDLFRSDYVNQLDPDVQARQRSTFRRGRAFRRFEEGPGWEGLTFEEDVAAQLDRICRSAIEEVVVVDLTNRRFGIPVVRVVVPGLEGLHGVTEPGVRARAVMQARG